MTNAGGHSGVDVDLDEMEVHLEPIFLCSKCNTRMGLVAPKRWRCPKCGEEFLEKEE